MEEWEDVDIEAVSDGLDALPTELHAFFEVTSDHLSEVRDRHTMMLVSSGELPEKHMETIAPERRLDWILEELNGVRHNNGLSIPLQGVSSDNVNLKTGEIAGSMYLKLTIGKIERRLPLPKDAIDVQAKFDGGILRLNW